MKLDKDKLFNLISSLKPWDNKRGNFVINCPKCDHREASISYNKENHPVGCFRKAKCGYVGNIYDLLKILGIKAQFTKDVNVLDDKLENISLTFLVDQLNSLSLPNKQLPLGYKRVYQNGYLDSRGFVEKDYQYWEVGKTSLLSSLKKYCIFPIYLEGQVKAYVGRREVKGEPKYNNSISDFSCLLGGFDKVTGQTHTVILCEGKLDIINVNRLLDLYDCEQIKPLCTFGAKLSHNQLELLKSKPNIKNIILLFDNDVVSKIKPISFELDLYFNTNITTIAGNNDPGDCSYDQLEKALNNVKSPFDFFIDNL